MDDNEDENENLSSECVNVPLARLIAASRRLKGARRACTKTLSQAVINYK